MGLFNVSVWSIFSALSELYSVHTHLRGLFHPTIYFWPKLAEAGWWIVTISLVLEARAQEDTNHAERVRDNIQVPECKVKWWDLQRCHLESVPVNVCLKKKKKVPLSAETTRHKRWCPSPPSPSLKLHAPCPEQTLGKRKQCQVETGDIWIEYLNNGCNLPVTSI